MNVPWYEREDIRDKLLLFGRAIQGIRPYQVILESDTAKCRNGCCSFTKRQITVNPTLFSVSAKQQYMFTKALLVHEAGHRRYTYPSSLPSLVWEVSNILEDERIENLMWEEFIGLRWLIQNLAMKFYEQSRTIDSSSDQPDEVIIYILQLRWATRIKKPVKGNLSAQNQSLWERVKPLVFESWQAKDTLTVNCHAARIVDILGFTNHNTHLRIINNPQKEAYEIKTPNTLLRW